MDFFNKFRETLDENNDLECFNEHLFPHARVIFSSAYRLSGNRQDAEDLAQETFYLAVKNFSQLKDLSKCKFWLFSILRNLFLKDVEKRKKHFEVEFDAICGRLHDDKNPEKDYLSHEIKANIRKVLQQLDDHLKDPIRLFYFEGQSYKEIAEALGIPIGTVMSRIARAKVHLKQELLRSDSFQEAVTSFSLIDR